MSGGLNVRRLVYNVMTAHVLAFLTSNTYKAEPQMHFLLVTAPAGLNSEGSTEKYWAAMTPDCAHRQP